MKLHEILEKYNFCQTEISKLNEDYLEKKKGNVYYTRYKQLVDKMESMKTAFETFGTHGTIILIRGTRKRIGKRNKNIYIDEKFELYLVNISLVEASTIFKMKVKNATEFTVSEIKPGKIITK